jgi:hypothetical protein
LDSQNFQTDLANKNPRTSVRGKAASLCGEKVRIRAASVNAAKEKVVGYMGSGFFETLSNLF